MKTVDRVDAPIEAAAEDALGVAMIADLACPWCHIGLVRLDQARAMRPDVPVRLRWWPFFLNPDMAPDGMDRQAYLRAKFGGQAAASRVYQRIVEAGADCGIPFAFERMPKTPNTLLAHRLVLHAERQGHGDALIRRLFRALFQEGIDIGDRGTLLALATEVGLDPATTAAHLAGDADADKVRQYHQRAGQLGVQGVPVYVADGEHAISGAQPAEVLAGLLDVARASRATPAHRA
jgi:predicted DsbA family dithiol-disulfide isomerase